MTDKRQQEIIAEQIQANRRILEAVENRDNTYKNQAPANERVKQLELNERIEAIEPDPNTDSTTNGTD